MTQLFEDAYRLLKTIGDAENQPEADLPPISTAAIPSAEESAPLHTDRATLNRTHN